MVIAFRVVLLEMRNKVLQVPAKEDNVVTEKHFTYLKKKRKDNFGTTEREPLLKEPLAVCFLIPDCIVYLLFSPFAQERKKWLSTANLIYLFFPCGAGDTNSGLPAWYACPPCSPELLPRLTVAKAVLRPCHQNPCRVR